MSSLIIDEQPNEKLLENTNVTRMINILTRFIQFKETLFQEDRVSLYHSFHIPKSSGGVRRIDAPSQELMNTLRELKTLFETHMFALYHTTAFAYSISTIYRHLPRNEQTNPLNRML